MGKDVRRVKLADIARATNLSVSTVSMVLRDKPGIPPETRERVMDAARSLGYRVRKAEVNHFGTNGKLKNIGLIVKYRSGEIPQTNQFYSQVIMGIEAACRQRRQNLLFATLLVDDDNNPIEIPHFLNEDTIAGLLLVGVYVDQKLCDLFCDQSIPIVLVDAYSPITRFDSILSDNFHGAYQAISFLIGIGHRRIALVGCHPNAYPSFEDRRRGYLHALSDHGILQPYFADSLSEHAITRQATIQLIREHPEITAIFGVNDDMAIAALNAVQSLGYRVPEDISIIGYDDIALATHVMPALTTVQVDKLQMGRIAVQLLNNRVEYPEAGRMTTVLHTQLIERESTGSKLKDE